MKLRTAVELWWPTLFEIKRLALLYWVIGIKQGFHKHSLAAVAKFDDITLELDQ
jgi:hypothetical protein